MTQICYWDEESGVQKVRDMTPAEEAQRTADIAAAQKIVPESLSPRQFLQALNHLGYRSQVDAAIASSTDQDLKDWYARSSEFLRVHPEVLAMATRLNLTSAQLDQVWTYGATI